MKALLPPRLFLLFSLLMGLACWYFQLTHFLAYPVNLAGLPMLIGGITLALFSKQQLRKVGTNVMTFGTPDRLVTTGLYRFSRNPTYLGLGIALVGVAVIYQGSILSLMLSGIFLLVLDRWYIRFEEKQMRIAFGQAYQDYCVTTRRWI